MSNPELWFRHADAATRALSVLGDKNVIESVTVWADRVEITMMQRFDLHFHHLQALADIFGSRLINIEGSIGSQDYSEVTPGGPGDCKIVIRKP
jgi:hypothetical protein